MNVHRFMREQIQVDDDRSVRLLWDTGPVDGTSIDRISAWAINGHVFLGMDFEGDNGFEIFAPVTLNNSISATKSAVLAAIEREDGS